MKFDRERPERGIEIGIKVCVGRRHMREGQMRNEILQHRGNGNIFSVNTGKHK